MSRDGRDDRDTLPASRAADDTARGTTDRVAVAATLDADSAAADVSTSSGNALDEGATVDGMRVMRLLGRGGMGEVYLARDTALGRKVALKRLRLGAGRAVESLLTEARALARCNHPHIVTIYAVGEFLGTPYLALEYLEGEDLASRIRRQMLTVGETLRIASAIADALSAAHGAGVLHRDLKPGNVMLPADGRLRVVDFGLAHPIEDGRSTGPLGVSGTPGYMAPEQWRGAACTPATDVWALGVMLYQMLANALPFPMRSAQAIKQATEGPRPAPPLPVTDDDLPATVVDLVARCLSKPPDDRPPLAEVVRILEAALHPDLGARVDEEGPFRGLEPFNERHAALFFGRDAELAAACDRLERAPVVLLAGPSGAGKSSFVHAGLIPRLRERARWTVLTVRPGTDPFAVVAARLSETRGPADLRAHPGALGQSLRLLARLTHRPVLLFVDQLEEAFALARDPQAADEFVEAICLAADDPSDRVRVVATVREAFLGRVAARAAGRFALRHLIVLERPSRSALVEILRRPLSLVGYAFEDRAMADEMVDAVDDSPARLPLLEFAARQLWDARDRERRVLTRAALDALGGVEGVLARHAEQALAGFPDPRPVRALCLRLVTADATRRVVARPDLIDGLGPAGADALDRLIDARLVSARRVDGRIDVELTHESLITQWARLRRWIEASRDALGAMAEVEAAAALWLQRGRRASELWDGDALGEARRAIDRVAEPPATIRDFVAAGEARIRRVKMRRRVIFGALVATLVAVAILLSGLARQADRARADAEDQARVAEQERREARIQARRAQGQQAAALRASARAAHAAGRALEARARLRAAMELEDHRGNRTLWQALGDAPLLWQHEVGSPVDGAALSPDGHQLALATQDTILRIFDLRDGHERRIQVEGDAILDVHWSAAGRLYAGTWGGGLLHVDAALGTARVVSGTAGSIVMGVAESVSGEVIFTLGPSLMRCRAPCVAPTRMGDMRHRVLDIAAAPTLNRFVVQAGGAVTYVVDLDRGTVEPIGGVATSVRRPTAFIDDDDLVVGNVHSELSVSRLPVAEGRVGSARLIWGEGVDGPTSTPRAIAYDRASGQLVMGDTLGGIWLGRLEGGFRRLGRHDSRITFLGFSAQGHVVSAGGGGDVRMWRTPPPELALRIEPVNEAGSMGLHSDPSGRLVTTSGRNVMIWTADGVLASRAVNTEPRSLMGARLIPGAARFIGWIGPRWYVGEIGVELLAPGQDTTSGGAPLQPLFASRGRLWATDGDDRIVSHPVLDARGEVVGDPRLLATAPGPTRYGLIADRQRVGVWRPGGGRPRWSLPAGAAYIRGGAFSPGGDRVAISRYDGVVLILDAETGRTVRRFALDDQRFQGVAMSADAIFVGALDGRVHRWTLADGAHHAAPAHQGTVQEVGLTADGQGIVTVGDDGLLRRWHLDLYPAWRSTALVVDPDDAHGPWHATHRGWRGAGDATPSWAGRPWARATIEGIAAAVDARRACVITPDGAVLSIERAGASGPRRFEVPGEFGGREQPQVHASGETCLVRAGDRVFVWPADAAAPVDVSDRLRERSSDGPSAGSGPTIALADGFALIAGRRLIELDARGDLRAAYAVPAGVTAVGHLADGGWILGLGDGSFGRYVADPQDRALRMASRIAHGAPSPVTAIAEAPMQTLVVGHANGQVALWGMAERDALRVSRLHGAIRHIGRVERRLVVTSDLGDHVEWSIAALLDDPCALMRAMWGDTPAVWRAGRPVAADPPRHHPCLPTERRP